MSVPQSFVKGLAGEFLREELGDVLPLQLNLSIWCNNGWRHYQAIFPAQLCATVLLLHAGFADVADQVAWRTVHRHQNCFLKKVGKQLSNSTGKLTKTMKVDHSSSDLCNGFLCAKELILKFYCWFIKC